MNSDLCIGIASKNDILELVALEPGKDAVVMKFPATEIGLNAIRSLIAGYRIPARLAVAGIAALGVALALGNMSGRETFIVSPAIANQALALAHYAEHAA